MSAPPTALFRQASRLYMVLVVLGLAWIAWRGGELGTNLLISPHWVRDLGAGLAGGATLLGAWWLVARLSATARRLEDELVALTGPLRVDEAYALAFFSAIAEEVFFRGAMLPAWGLLASTVLFGVLHIGPGRSFLVWTASALIAGWGLGALTLWAGGALLAPIAAHALVNAVQLPRLARRANQAHAAAPPEG